MSKKKLHLTMRCAANCGVFVRATRERSIQSLEKESEDKGFVKIGLLYYCPRCAKKRQSKEKVDQ